MRKDSGGTIGASNGLDGDTWANLAESLAIYEALVADLSVRREEIVRAERRIGLMAAMLSIDGISVTLPADMAPEIAGRLLAQIEAAVDFVGRRSNGWAGLVK